MIYVPLTLAANTPLSEGIAQMQNAPAGCIVITDQEKLIGILTERDLVRAIASGKAVEGATVSSVMNSEVLTLKASQAQDLSSAFNFMRQHRLHHLPLVDEEDCLVGLLEMDTLLQELSSDCFQFSTKTNFDRSALKLEVPANPSLANLRKKAEQERLLATISLRISQFLKLEEILNATVTELQQLLQTDRVLIYRLFPDGSGNVVVEAVSDRHWSILGQVIQDTCFESNWLIPYQEGCAKAVADIYKEPLSSCYVEFLAKLQVKANLIVPILQGREGGIGRDSRGEKSALETSGHSPKESSASIQMTSVWGLICLHQCTNSRQWQPEEIGLLEKLAIQVAISIQQASLFEQLQGEISQRQKVESILQKKEETLRLALELTNMGTWDWDLITNKISWSKTHESLFGFAPGTFDGNYQTFETCVHPDDQQSLQAALNHSLLERQDYYHEFRVIWSDGSVHWIEAKGKYIYNGEEQPVRMLGTVVEVSNRKQAEILIQQQKDELELRISERTAQLSEANKLLQKELFERKQAEAERVQLISILEATSDMVATVTSDLKLCYLNRAARKMFGLGESEDLDNFSIRDAHPQWAYDIVVNQGIPAAIRDGIWVGETAFISSGQEIPMSQLIIAHFAPNGKVKLISTIARDISKQKQIEATVREAERRWRSFLENIRLVVVGLDLQGKVEYANPFLLELVGYSESEIMGIDWLETFLLPFDRKRMQEKFSSLSEQNYYTYYHNCLITKSGEQKVIAWNSTLLRNLQGEVVGTMSIGEDITEREAIERMKNEFISVVSHELRTPLTSIYGALNLIVSGLIEANSEKGKRVIDIAAKSADRLVRLVNDILDLERLQSGKMTLLKQVVNAADLLLRATEQMQVMASRAGIMLCLSTQDIQLEADADRLLQVLTNLLSNAIKFSPKGSRVWLSVEQIPVDASQLAEGKQPSILFSVKDEGRGIPADKSETIFERFQQVDASDSRKKEGTGLGLAICRSIVEQHGGEIWVESILDVGSNFYFRLPIIQQETRDGI